MDTHNRDKDQELLQERINLALVGYNAGLYEWNMLDNSAYYSDEWRVMLGLSVQEMKPELSTWADLVHPNDLENIMKSVNEAIQKKEKTIEAVHRLKHKNGEWLWILGRGFIEYDKDEKPIRMVGFHTNITDQKSIELKLKYQAQIIEQTFDSIITTDINGKILIWNKGSQRLFKYTSAEVLDKNIDILQSPTEPEWFKHILMKIKSNKQFSKELELQTKTGKQIYVNVSFSMFNCDEENLFSIIMYSHDISTEVREKKHLLEEKKKLEYKANHDVLTGLPNRELFYDRLERSMIKAKRENLKMALFFIDLDHFKEINDSLGHEVGDVILQEIAKRLKKLVREEDTIARLGGDEFTLIIGELKSINDTTALAKKLIDALKKPIAVQEKKLNVSASIGISIFPDDASSCIDLVRCADSAMYKAKSNGRSNYQYYQS